MNLAYLNFKSCDLIKLFIFKDLNLKNKWKSHQKVILNFLSVKFYSIF